jgi:hypothetical protein
MGLLDDAIREHLELKRRSGADASELAKLEHDAFGPVRGGEPATADAEDLPTPHEHEVAAHDDLEAPLAGLEELEPEEEYVFEDEPEPLAPAAAEPPPLREPEPEPYEPLAREPEPAPEPAEDPQRTVAFSVEDLHAAEHPHAPDPDAPVRHGYDDDDATAPHPEPNEPETLPDPDVIPADDEPIEHDELEETPDFLQETPEHDRLWFEQKPPRDFDF